MIIIHAGFHSPACIEMNSNEIISQLFHGSDFGI
jgi:hypothetical protein